MTMIKELEEARFEMGKKLIAVYEEGLAKKYPDYDRYIGQILNLKGENWRIAIVKNEDLITKPTGFVQLLPVTQNGIEVTTRVDIKRVANYKQVIWQAGDEKENCI